MQLLFFFDFSSPFAYLGATQVERVARRSGARLFYRPFLLGGLFKQIGTPDVPFFAMPAAKQRHTSDDMQRWAEHWRVPFRFPSRFPMNTTKALRMVLQLPEEQRSRLVHPIFAAYWAEDRDIGADAVLTEIATSAGFRGAGLVAEAREQRWKNALRSATEKAELMGVCGAPSFVVRDPKRPMHQLMFWGQDRLMLVEKALGGWAGSALDLEQPAPEALEDELYEQAPETRQAQLTSPALPEPEPESLTRVPRAPLDESTRFEPLAARPEVRPPLPSIGPEEHTRPDMAAPSSIPDEPTVERHPRDTRGDDEDDPPSQTDVRHEPTVRRRR